MFSALLLQQHAQKYDFNIWCITVPGRFSVQIDQENWFHSAIYMNSHGILNVNRQSNNYNIVDACQKYLKYVFDHNAENLVGQALTQNFLSTMSNLMIIPCFGQPLPNSFNLYEHCTKEAQVIYPNNSIPELYAKYQDMRVCHLTNENNRRLADLINQKLQHGIFFAEYDQFDLINVPKNIMQPLSFLNER